MKWKQYENSPILVQGECRVSAGGGCVAVVTA